MYSTQHSLMILLLIVTTYYLGHLEPDRSKINHRLHPHSNREANRFLSIN